MADEIARVDENRHPTMIGVNDSGEIRKVKVNDQGEMLVDTSGSPESKTLTERMMAKEPFDSTYRLWVDTANTSYIYVAENVSGTADATATFRGIRVPKDSSGNLLGNIQERTAFAWTDRTSNLGWT